MNILGFCCSSARIQGLTSLHRETPFQTVLKRIRFPGQFA
jgi:hypothetical protein